jgi:hypothetical protein
MRQPLNTLLTIIVSPFTRGCQQVDKIAKRLKVVVLRALREAGSRFSQRRRPFMPLCGHSLRSAARAYDAPLRHSFDA